jgi:hypothetical protein
MVTLVKIPLDAIFSCEKCHFVCNKKGDWNRHLATNKHIQMFTVTSRDDISHNKNYICSNCDKTYNSRNGLWNHKKKCITAQVVQKSENISDLVGLLINENKDFKNVMEDLVKSNQDLQKQILIVCDLIKSK